MFAEIDYDFFTIASVCTPGRPSPLAPEKRITSITNSSLEVRPGSLFVPLLDKRDGHDFIADAALKGAAAFFLKKGHPATRKLSADLRALAIEVEDPLAALGKLAQFHRNRFAPLIIAVTGSNGKTTTKEMLAQIFKRTLGKKCIATEKNYNNHIGLPFTLFAIRKDTRVAVLEMGMNHAGEIAYLSRLAAPHAALISSVGHAHIEFFKSRAGIAAAKAEILEGMLPGGSLYVPAQVAELQTIAAAARQKKAELIKIDTHKDALLKIEETTPQGFKLRLGKEKIFFPHANIAWVSNLALAAAAAHNAGIATEAIAHIIRKFKPAAGRMQLKKGYFTVIDDGYNANPDSAVSSIDAALQVAAGKPVVCVFGDFKEMGKLSRKLHAWTGSEAARKGIAAFYGVGTDMRHAMTAFRQRAKTARSYAFNRDAVPALIEQLAAEKKGSVILVKGSRAMRMEEIVAALLEKKG